MDRSNQIQGVKDFITNFLWIFDPIQRGFSDHLQFAAQLHPIYWYNIIMFSGVVLFSLVELEITELPQTEIEDCKPDAIRICNLCHSMIVSNSPHLRSSIWCSWAY